MVKYKNLFKVMILASISISMLNIDYRAINANFEGFILLNGDCGEDVNKSESGAKVSGVIGNWTQKGTIVNQNAQMIFDNLTQKLGFSGAGAAGALAVAARESKFDPQAINSSGGVAGWFQWSGFTNSVNGSRITSEGSIKAGDKSTLTPDNEIKLLNFELNGAYKKAKMKVGMANEPYQAAKDWSLLYEGVALEDGQSKLDQLKTDSQAAYEVFGGASIPANSAILGADGAANTGNMGNKDADNSCSMNVSSNDIVAMAQSLLGYFSYGQTHGVANIGSIENPNKNGVTDCSGFVWLVLKKAGYKVPDNMGWFTQSMEEDAKGAHQWLKEISESEAKAGDIVIVNTGDGSGNNGHTAILEEDWKSAAPKNNNTKIIQEGGQGGKGGVNEGTFKESFSGLIDGDFTITFARAIKK